MSALIAVLLSISALFGDLVCTLPEFRFDREVMHMAPAVAWMGPATFLGSLWIGPTFLYRGRATLAGTIGFMALVTGGNMMMVGSELGRETLGHVVATLIPALVMVATVQAVREWYTGPVAAGKQSPEASDEYGTEGMKQPSSS